MLNKSNKFFALNAGNKLLFCEAFLLLVFSKVVIFFIPLRISAKYFGVLNLETKYPLTQQQQIRSQQIRTAIFMTSANVPWKSVCLDQALATMIMLNRRKIPNTLYLGVKMNHENKKLDAHAWVECDEKILVGGTKSKSFSVVAFFAKNPNNIP